MYIRQALVLNILIVSSCLAANGSIQVVSATPGWQTNGGAKLTAGQILDSKESISSSSLGDLVLHCPLAGLILYSCREGSCQLKPCEKPEKPGLQVTAVEEIKPSAIAGLLALLTRDNSQLQTLGVKGSEEDLNDAVISIQGDELQLGPALTRVLDGNYCFTFTLLPETGSQKPQTIPLALNKSDEPDPKVKVEHAHEGLYVVTKEEKDAAGSCRKLPDAYQAWVLLVSSARFRQFDELWKSSRPWFSKLNRNGVSPGILATMRHAKLAELSESLK